MESLKAQFFSWMEPDFSRAIEEALKLLLEKKHLYQTLHISLPTFEIVIDNVRKRFEKAPPLLPPLGEKFLKVWREVYDTVPELGWRINSPFDRKIAGFVTDFAQTEEVFVSIGFTPATIKVYCKNCERVEAYNYVRGMEVFKELESAKSYDELLQEQVFLIGYQCQACKSLPEIFMVRRNKNKITLSGRTPMEHIEVPNYLPKNQVNFFSDAVVAFNSGFTLAGIFLLRTFIEQYIRSISDDPNSQNIEAIFSEYAEKLPKDFKERFPSLKQIYDALSDDIHGAHGSEEVFTESRDQIEKHFDAKRLFKI